MVSDSLCFVFYEGKLRAKGRLSGGDRVLLRRSDIESAGDRNLGV